MISLPPSLSAILTSVAVVVGLLIAASSAIIIGPQRIRSWRHAYRRRLREGGPLLAVLLVLLAVNSVARDIVPEISRIVGVNVTGLIYAIEGRFIADLQEFASAPLTAYFSFMYVYGYVFLLVFPFLAYASLDDLRYFKELVVANIVNYGVGLVCYTAFIAYGPRNLMPELVKPLLYSQYPAFHLLTTEVNANTNVFPSLHTSMSVTVALLAYRTRHVYPGWAALATGFALSITTATMYLGIHWATDVVAGVGLAALAVVVARYYVRRTGGDAPGTGRLARVTDGVLTRLQRLFDPLSRR